LVARVVIEVFEDHPGEANEKRGEILKSVVTRLGGLVVEPHQHIEEPPDVSMREATAAMTEVFEDQVRMMLADVERLLRRET
jgi:hypothetical protein